MDKGKTKTVDTTNYCGFTEDEMFGLYRIKSSPLYWRQKAEELKYSADVLWPIALRKLDKINSAIKKNKAPDFQKLPPDVFNTAKGLLGFSLECLFKAVIIRDNPNLIDKGEQNNKLKTHNLLKLAEIGKIALNSDERHTCEVLTDAMYVDFRYPTDQKITPQKGGMTVGRSIIDVGNELYDKLHGTVNQIHTVKGGAINFDWTSARFAPKKEAKKSVALKAKKKVAKKVTIKRKK